MIMEILKFQKKKEKSKIIYNKNMLSFSLSGFIILQTFIFIVGVIFGGRMALKSMYNK